MPERTARGSLRFASLRPHAVGGDPRLLAIAVLSEHVPGDREALEILGVQLPLALSRRQISERVAPHPSRERATGPLLTIGDSHQPPRYAQTR